MKTAVILGAGQAGTAVSQLLNPNSIEIAAFGDNDPAKRDKDAEIQVLSVEEALLINPDLVLICVLSDERCQQFQNQIQNLGYQGNVLTINEIRRTFSIRTATLKRMAERIREQGIPGDMAELGVFRGDFAWQINELFPDRKLYLFDTFGGFPEKDILTEKRNTLSKAEPRDFSNTTAEDVLARLPFEKQAVIRKGYFPGTAEGLEASFALVSIDADLYAPTLAGLKYFYPRMSPGGVILLHDYYSRQFEGVQKAVKDYEEEFGRLPLVPLSDIHGTAVIVCG